MYTEKISNRQFLYILFIQRTTVVISFLPALTSADARQDAWAAALLTIIPSTLLVFILGKLATGFPDRSIVQYSRELVGPWVGAVLVSFFLLQYLHMASTDLRLYSEIINVGFLTETPQVLVMAFMILPAYSVVYHGLESLGRCADIIFFLFMIMVLSTLLAPLPKMEFGNLEPVLARGWSPILEATIIPTQISVQFINLLMIVPSLTEPKKGLRTALWANLLSIFMLVLFAIVVVGILGPDEGSRAAFPVFKMIRSTRITNFLERIEALTIFAWGLGLFVTNAINLYSSSKGLSQLLGMRNYRPLLLPMVVLIVAMGLQQYDSLFEIQLFFTPQIAAPIIFFIVLFPLTVLWVAYFIKKH